MSVEFHECTAPPLEPFTASVPSGFVIGVIGDDGAGKQTLLRLATGTGYPVSGCVTATDPHRYHGPFDPIVIGQAKTLALYHTLALKDAAVQVQTAMDLEIFRRNGGTAFLVSHDLELIARIADEVWWLHHGHVQAKGDPRSVVDQYKTHLAQSFARIGNGMNVVLPQKLRRGDGRASLIALETLNAEGTPVSVWQAGATAQVRVTVRFAQPVNDPVIGMLIRTRIGFEVYGTNTELEGVALGPRLAGDTIQVTFRFDCHLCPHEYTLTAASHDPDGVWHDWVEDGVAFSVSDHRYTAGVACLRAGVEVKVLP